MMKTASLELQISATWMSARQEEGRSGGEIEWKLSDVNTRAVSKGQNKLIGKCKIAAGDVINITR
jgi:hypothetical protein